MASISAGTRNLKFMQRGKQLPANPIPASPAQAATSSKTAAPSAQASNRAAQPPPTESSAQEEEEWVLPSRIRSSAKGKGKASLEPSGKRKDSARPRVVVVNEASYLAFVGSEGQAKTEDGKMSDDESEAGAVSANGRMSFGTLPTKQTLDTSLVDNRERMSHAKAITTSADRFAVFASADGEPSSSSSRRKGNGEEHVKPKDGTEERRRRPARESNTRENSEKEPSTSTPARTTRQGFLRPSNYDDMPLAARGKPPRNDNDHETPATSSKRGGKKRKSDQQNEDQVEDMLVEGARARGKRSKKQQQQDKSDGPASSKTRRKEGNMDEDAMAAEIAGGAIDDAEVERYLESVMQEMRDD